MKHRRHPSVHNALKLIPTYYYYYYKYIADDVRIKYRFIGRSRRDSPIPTFKFLKYETPEPRFLFLIPSTIQIRPVFDSTQKKMQEMREFFFNFYFGSLRLLVTFRVDFCTRRGLN